MTTEYSIQKMVSDGTLSTVTLGIQYLQRNDIYMRIAGEETPQTGATNGYTWTFVDNTTIKILPIVPTGIEVVVYRRTDADEMYNVFNQNAQFDESTIDENNTQLLFLSQEYLEQGSGIEAVEYLRSEGEVHYYRLQLYGGRYTDEFTITTQLPPGYIRGVGDFVTGFTVMPGMRNVVWLNPSPTGDNNLYSWSGEVPQSGKVVPPNSTPETTGGFVNAWVPRTDETLRSELGDQNGSSLVGMRQSNVMSETPFVSPEMYGAAPSKSPADTAAVLAAFTASHALGVNVKLSRRYDCTSNISLSGYVSEVFGVNQSECGIDFGVGFGFIIDNSGITGFRRAVKFSSLTIRAAGDRQGVAIDFTGVRGRGYGPQLECRSITITGDGPTRTSFDTAFKLYAAGESLFDFVTVSGISSNRMPVVFDLHSSKDVKVVNGSFSDFQTFMYAHDDTEGVVVAFNHIIAGYRGVVSRDNVGNLFTIIGNHFSTSLSAVELGEGTGSGSNHCKISDNFCIVFNVPEHASTPYIGFDICSNKNSLSNNEVLLTELIKDCTNTVLRKNTSGTRTATGNSISKPIGTQISRNVHIRADAAGNHIYGSIVTGVSSENDIIDDSGNATNRYWKMEADSNFNTRHIALGRIGTASVVNISAYTTTDKGVQSGTLRFIGGAAGVVNGAILESTCREVVIKDLRPSTGNTYTCGNSGSPWSGGFTQTAFTVTSDERLKVNIASLLNSTNEAEMAEFRAMISAWREVDFFTYQFIDRVEKKGRDGARWHLGIIAQRAIAAFTKHGLDWTKYAIFNYDKWDAKPAIYDDDGGVIHEAIEAGDKYTINYEEALILESVSQRDRCDSIEARLSALEAR